MFTVSDYNCIMGIIAAFLGIFGWSDGEYESPHTAATVKKYPQARVKTNRLLLLLLFPLIPIMLVARSRTTTRTEPESE